MSKPDFSALLSKPADEVKAPPVLPEGTYFGVIKSHELGESAKKKTPYVKYHLTIQGAGDDINQADLNGIDLGAKKASTDFYLSDDAQFMFVEFCQKAGIETSGKSLGQLVPEPLGLNVLIAITQRTSDDGERIFNDVKSIRPNV